MSNTPTDNINSLKKELLKRSEFFSVILEFLREKGRKTKSEITQYLVDSFQIRRELMDIPKKDGTSLYENRMAWALFDLHKTGMIRIVERTVYEITDRGVQVSHLEFTQMIREINGCLADERKSLKM